MVWDIAEWKFHWWHLQMGIFHAYVYRRVSGLGYSCTPWVACVSKYIQYKWLVWRKKMQYLSWQPQKKKMPAFKKKRNWATMNKQKSYPFSVFWGGKWLGLNCGSVLSLTTDYQVTTWDEILPHKMLVEVPLGDVQNQMSIWLQYLEFIQKLRKIQPWKLTCPLKRDYLNRKYIHLPTIDFQGTCWFSGEYMFCVTSRDAIPIVRWFRIGFLQTLYSWECAFCDYWLMYCISSRSARWLWYLQFAENRNMRWFWCRNIRKNISKLRWNVFFSVETTESKNPVSLKNMFFKNCLMILLMEKNPTPPARRGPPSYKVVITPTNPMKNHGCKWVFH